MLSVSIGTAVYPEGGATIDSLFQSADRALCDEATEERILTQFRIPVDKLRKSDRLLKFIWRFSVQIGTDIQLRTRYNYPCRSIPGKESLEELRAS